MLNARFVSGPFRQLRWGANVLLIAILVAIPWVRIRGEPLVLLDIPHRKFHVVGLVIFPQELYFLWLIVAGLALALFFFTALAGRVWCGWACPQTVFTDLFAALARRLQGWTRTGPPTHVALWRRLATHALWLAISALVGFHLVAYFHSPYAFVSDLRTGHWSSAATGFWVATTGLSYFDFVLLRQTFCKYLCPYARFQSVLFDRETLVVAYDAHRGEPRGKRGTTSGDCVDCGLCVAVCPSEIDIRDGMQLECIACTQCIDACNNVMHSLRRTPNLIGYRSLASVEDHRPARPLRPRVVVYGALLLTVAVAFGIAIGWRMPLDLQVTHNRDVLYQKTADGRIGNAYTLHIENRDRHPHDFRLELSGAEAYELVAGVNPIPVPATSAMETRVFVLAAADAVSDGRAAHRIDFVLQPVDDPRLRVVRTARFVLPGVAAPGGP